ncbi:MAG: class I SAM-dependent methyltransferase [Alphaproteobacteria bacterium]
MTDTQSLARDTADLTMPGTPARSLSSAVSARFFKACAQIKVGTLHVIAPDGQLRHFGAGSPEAHFHIHDWSAIAAVVARGDIGLGEAYINGLWDSPSIDLLTQLALLNEDAFSGHLHGSFLNRALFLLTDRLMRRNSKRGSAKNIQAHYDVGNDFYSLWLDDSMTYSSALFDQPGLTLERAQARKYQRLLEVTEQPGGGGRTLEIGCGWGGFAEAALADGRDVTAITISPAQKAYADARLGGKADIRLCDYRDIQGQYDAIVSIEMIEAVGERYWPTYFETLKRCLAPGGKAVVQAIIVEDDHFPNYRKRSDFIRHYTFPGGMLLAPGPMAEAAKNAGLAVHGVLRFGQDYAETLRRWTAAFEDAAPQIRALGYPEAFLRSWRFYLAICTASFQTTRTDVIHMEFSHA